MGSRVKRLYGYTYVQREQLLDSLGITYRQLAARIKRWQEKKANEHT